MGHSFSFQVELRHGVKMLSNLKDYHEGACILDDFAFYEEKERSQEPYRRNIVRHHQVKIFVLFLNSHGFVGNLLWREIWQKFSFFTGELAS